MTIEINEDTPFAADITANDEEREERYRVTVDDDGLAMMYREAVDVFGTAYWEELTPAFNQSGLATTIIVELAKQGRVTA